MEFLRIREPAYYDGYSHWRNPVLRCPADTAEEEMECTYYEPLDTVDWMCRHCDGDICRYDD